uniref:RdRp n=1 Tax=viral metagenome TaxID=1070528 RepID=A0A2V0RAN5_9ZZZZ
MNDSKIIPEFLHLKGIHYNVCNKEDSDFLLIELKEGKYLNNYNTNHLLRICGGVVESKAIYFKTLNITAFYINKNYNMLSIPQLSKIVLARLQYGYNLNCFNIQTENEILYSTMNLEYNFKNYLDIIKENLKYGKFIKKILDGKINIPFSRVSARHLRFLIPEQINRILQKVNDKELIDRINIIGYLISNSITKDMNEAAFVSIIIYILLLNREDFVLIYNSGIFKSKSLEEYKNKAKSLSLRMKSIQNIISKNLTVFFELEVLVNRGFGEINWDEERSNRSDKMNLTSHKYNEIYNEAIKMFNRSKLENKKPTKTDWENYYKKRFETNPTGAFHSQHKDDLKYIPKERELRNKFVISNLMPYKEIEYFLKRKPEIAAWESVKYEWAKMRAIYGVDYTNFILTNYGFLGCEMCLPMNCPVGSLVNEEYVTEATELTLLGNIPYCTDFEDFNSGHSITSQIAVLTAYRDTNYDSLDKNQIKAINWCIKSITNMNVYEGQNIKYKVKGTMFSGWRLTSFMNTSLNYIYKQIAVKDNRYILSLHNGDDALLGVKYLCEVLNIEKKYKEKNVRLQNTKCFLGGIAEFLRVDRKSKTSSQYLSRSVSTLVHGTTESIIPNNVHATLESIIERNSEVIARGGSKEIVKLIEKEQVDYIFKKWKIINIDFNDFRNTHKCFGGLSSDKNALTKNEYIITNINKLDESESTILKYDFKGAGDYADILIKDIFEESMRSKITNTIIRALTSGLKNNRWTIQVDNTNKRSIMWPELIKQKYKYLKGDITYKKAQMLKMFGLPLVGIRGGNADAYKELLQYNDMLYWASKIM